MNQKIEFPDVLKDPGAVFSSPQSVVKCQQLSVIEKLEVLRQWEQDSLGLDVAAEENMAGGEQSRLQEIRKAISRLSDGNEILKGPHPTD